MMQLVHWKEHRKKGMHVKSWPPTNEFSMHLYILSLSDLFLFIFFHLLLGFLIVLLPSGSSFYVDVMSYLAASFSTCLYVSAFSQSSSLPPSFFSSMFYHRPALLLFYAGVPILICLIFCYHAKFRYVFLPCLMSSA